MDSLIENTKSGFSSTGGICSANYGMCNGDIIQKETPYTPFSIAWDRPSVLQAEGGMYTFTYDANVNSLKIAYTPFDTENVTVDFTYQSVVLKQQGNSTIYTGTVNLYSDIHMFSINEFGTVYRSGWTYTNQIENAVHSSTLYNNTGIKVYYQYAGEYSIAYCTKTKRLSLMPITE